MRADGSLLVTRQEGAPRALAVLGVLAGVALIVSAVTQGASLFGAVVTLPLGVIAVLAGLAAGRHRDWVLVDRQARAIVCRQGLLSIFRPARLLAFDDVDAIVVESDERAGDLRVHLEGGGVGWSFGTNPEAARGLAATLHAAGNWPVVHREAPLDPVPSAGPGP
jgi:hypothetical protein